MYSTWWRKHYVAKVITQNDFDTHTHTQNTIHDNTNIDIDSQFFLFCFEFYYSLEKVVQHCFYSKTRYFLSNDETHGYRFLHNFDNYQNEPRTNRSQVIQFRSNAKPPLSFVRYKRRVNGIRNRILYKLFFIDVRSIFIDRGAFDVNV